MKRFCEGFDLFGTWGITGNMVDFGNNSKKCRFVCPDDRQLALRAKLRTGWSVKTDLPQHQTSVNPPIANEEHEAILDVIRRAEKVDKNEQERIGRLVDRLENMQRNALGKNPTQCVICGEYFGILRPQKVCCVDCKMFVCQKCSIENISSSLIPLRMSKDQWLCMICVETREIWKKSGAWFFKRLPLFAKPGQLGIFNRSGGSRKNKKSGQKDDDSSSDEDSRLWKGLKRRNLLYHGVKNVDDYSPTLQPSPHTTTSQTATPVTDLSKLSKEYDPLRSYMSASSLNNSNEVKNNQILSISSQVVWEDCSINCFEHRLDSISSRTNNDVLSLTGVEGLGASRRESIASRSVSEQFWTDSKSDDKLISPCASIASNQMFNITGTTDHNNSEPTLGTMELSLTYDGLTSTLHCTVYRAKNLIPMDINGLADPFCKLNILPNPKVSSRLRTKTVHKTRNPEFNENLTFYDISETDLLKKYLCVLVVDDDRYGHDYMGETRIPLGKLKIQNTIYFTIPLEKLRVEPKVPTCQPEPNEWFDDMSLRGQIMLSLSYNTKRRALLVTILKCTNLLPMDNNGFSDPFVKLHLTPDPYHRKHKTSIKWKNLNPVFNEEFGFESRPNELTNQSLYITVWDKDYGKSNDYLGGLILGGVGSKGQRLKHWLDMIKYPDHRHVYWHNLTEEQLN